MDHATHSRTVTCILRKIMVRTLPEATSEQGWALQLETAMMKGTVVLAGLLLGAVAPLQGQARRVEEADLPRWVQEDVIKSLVNKLRKAS